MRFCPDCGTGHECEAETGGRTDPSVEIARINADRDIAVAKLQARMQREELDTVEEVTEVQAEAEVTAAVAEAEIVGAALEAGVIDTEPEPEPIVIDAPDLEPEPDGDELPPAEGSPAPEAGRKRVGLGMW